jgi:hypothetical protein
MRSLLVLLAAVGLPLYALAQPVDNDSKSTEVSEITVEADKVAGCPIEDSHFPSKWYDAPKNSKNKKIEESAGTREVILSIITGQGNNNIAYTHIHPDLAKIVRAQAPHTNLIFTCLGAYKGINFLQVSQSGWDDFEVVFSNGALEWAVKPFDSHQMTEAIVFRYFYPQPATKKFEDWLKSMERDRPDYADLAPDLASKLQVQWPVLQKLLNDWGRLKGFRFVRQENDGVYVYLATYEHRQVVWTASPPNADGKFTALTYDEKAG